jgi:hypothetical protein
VIGEPCVRCVIRPKKKRISGKAIKNIFSANRKQRAISVIPHADFADSDTGSFLALQVVRAATITPMAIVNVEGLTHRFDIYVPISAKPLLSQCSAQKRIIARIAAERSVRDMRLIAPPNCSEWYCKRRSGTMAMPKRVWGAIDIRISPIGERDGQLFTVINWCRIVRAAAKNTVTIRVKYEEIIRDIVCSDGG